MLEGAVRTLTERLDTIDKTLAAGSGKSAGVSSSVYFAFMALSGTGTLISIIVATVALMKGSGQ